MAALELGYYVSGFMKSLVIFPSYSEDGILQFNHYEELRSHLEESFQSYVPNDRDREITHVLIRHFIETCCELMRSINFRKICKKVAPIVLKSVLHPSANDLDAIRAIAQPNLVD
jgi:hypothetical protein